MRGAYIEDLTPGYHSRDPVSTSAVTLREVGSGMYITVFQFPHATFEMTEDILT